MFSLECVYTTGGCLGGVVSVLVYIRCCLYYGSRVAGVGYSTCDVSVFCSPAHPEARSWMLVVLLVMEYSMIFWNPYALSVTRMWSVAPLIVLRDRRVGCMKEGDCCRSFRGGRFWQRPTPSSVGHIRYRSSGSRSRCGCRPRSWVMSYPRMMSCMLYRER